MNAKNEKLWFRAKTDGWGWTPATWEGWAIVVGYVVSLAAWMLYYFLSRPVMADANLVIEPVMTVLVATTGLVAICMLKGERPDDLDY